MTSSSGLTATPGSLSAPGLTAPPSPDALTGDAGARSDGADDTRDHLARVGAQRSNLANPRLTPGTANLTAPGATASRPGATASAPGASLSTPA